MAFAVRMPVDWLPLTGSLPDHAPDAKHEVALLADQRSVELLSLVTVLGEALTMTLGDADFVDTVTDCVALPLLPVQVRIYVAVWLIAPVD